MVAKGGIDWHVSITGHGPVALLLHGTGASSHSFAALTPLLAERFTVVTPDLPGHAQSRVPRTFEPTLPATAAAIDELLTELDLQPAIAIGHSAGAAIAARLTLDRSIAPRLLVGLAAALFPLGRVARRIFPTTARLLSEAAQFLPLRVRTSEGVQALLRSTGSSLDSTGVEHYRALTEQPEHVAAVLAMMAAWDVQPLYDELPTLTVPLVLIAGESDRAVPLRQQRAIAARVPNAQLMVVPHAGHLVHEEQPRDVARLALRAAAVFDL